MKNLNNQSSENLFPFLWVRQETEKQIFEEIRKIKESGIDAFCVESRPFYPERIEKGKPESDFNTESWFKRFGYILSVAKSLDMKVWLLDDERFPTGIANGKYAERKDLLPRQISCNFIDVVSFGEPFSVMSSVRVDLGDRILRAVAFPYKNNKVCFEKGIDLAVNKTDETIGLKVKKGVYRIAVLTETTRFSEFPFYMDVLNGESVKLLIDEVYEKHYARFKDYFGNVFVGFFSDEPRFGNGWRNAKISGFPDEFNNVLGKIGGAYPYSDEVANALLEKGFGLEYFTGLFTDIGKDTAEFRCQYADIITDIYSRNFTGQISSWCHERGVQYCGHVIEDMGAHCRFGCGVGNYFKAMDGADMAGIDVVLHSIKPYLNESEFLSPVGICEPRSYKTTLAHLASSSASLDAEKDGKAVCEIFGAYGFGETVKQMLYLANHMLVSGINRFIPHAFSMDFPDEDCPPHFYCGGNIPSYAAYKKLFSYINTMSEKFSGGKRLVSVAILYHAEAEQGGKEYLSMELIADILLKNQIDFDFIPYYKLKENEEKYKILLMPNGVYPTFVRESLNKTKIKRVIVGKELKLKEVCSYLFNNKYAEKLLLNKADNLRIMRYEKDGETYALAFADGLKDVTAELKTTTNLKAVDMLNGKENTLKRTKSGCILFVESGGCVVIEKGKAREEKAYKQYRTIKEFVVEQKRFDEETFTEYHGFDKDFSGYIRYVFNTDLSKTKKIKIDYCGEYCKVEIGKSEYLFIDKAEFSPKESGEQKITITVCNTLANALKDRFSAYAAMSSCSVKKVVLYKERQKS